MVHDYKEPTKKLIRALADALIRFIDELPNDDKNDLRSDFENETDTTPVTYSKRKTKHKPLKFD